MKFCMYVNQVTPHLMPLAREVIGLVGVDEVRYVYDQGLESDRRDLGWSVEREPWVVDKNSEGAMAREWVEGCDILLCERRDLDLWERRAKRGKGLYYTSERWFKPLMFGLPGWLRLLSPAYFKMARRAARLFDKYSNLIYLCNGFYAARDFIKLSRFMRGSVFALFTNPRLNFERRPFGRVVCDGSEISQVRMWSYFVAPSEESQNRGIASDAGKETKVLWVGRFLALKRVDTIVRAALACPSVRLDLHGVGPEEANLRKLAGGCERIRFCPPVPVGDVRRLMREHDVYVLSSNELEGWGAVVNEALEEGMSVVGTFEAGASRSLLPQECLFHAGDWKHLAQLLRSRLPQPGIGAWSAKIAAARILGENMD